MEIVKDNPELESANRAPTTEVKQQEVPPIVGEYDVPSYNYTLTSEEFKLLTQPLLAFEWALAIRTNLINKAKVEGGVVPVFENNTVTDGSGQRMLKQSFVEKYLPKQVKE